MKERIHLRAGSRKAKPGILILVLLCPLLVLSGTQGRGTSSSQEHPAHHKFRLVLMAMTLPKKGALSGYGHKYEAEDGTPIYDSGDDYKSAPEASSALDRLVKRATRVVKQGTKKDAKGRIIGRRVELSFSHGRGAKPDIVIAWTDGPWVNRLSSTSLPLLLDFESQHP